MAIGSATGFKMGLISEAVACDESVRFGRSAFWKALPTSAGMASAFVAAGCGAGAAEVQKS
jgi:hypothetical protein